MRPKVSAEDVLDGEELARYRAQKAHSHHLRVCRDPFCDECSGAYEDQPYQRVSEPIVKGAK